MARQPIYALVVLASSFFAAASTLATRLQLIEHKELTEAIVEHNETFLTKDEYPTKYDSSLLTSKVRPLDLGQPTTLTPIAVGPVFCIL